MAIITISRGSYFRGKEVAEKLAQKLGLPARRPDGVLRLLDRDAVLPPPRSGDTCKPRQNLQSLKS